MLRPGVVVGEDQPVGAVGAEAFQLLAVEVLRAPVLFAVCAVMTGALASPRAAWSASHSGRCSGCGSGRSRPRPGPGPGPGPVELGLGLGLSLGIIQANI